MTFNDWWEHSGVFSLTWKLKEDYRMVWEAALVSTQQEDIPTIPYTYKCEAWPECGCRTDLGTEWMTCQHD